MPYRSEATGKTVFPNVENSCWLWLMGYHGYEGPKGPFSGDVNSFGSLPRPEDALTKSIWPRLPG